MGLSSLISVLCIFILIGLGLLAARLRWLDMTSAAKLALLIVNLAMPAQVLEAFNTYFVGKLDTVNILLVIGIPFMIMTACGLVAWGLAALIKVPRERLGVFITMCSMPNTGFIGIPILYAIFGDVGVAYGAFFLVTNMVMCYSVCYFLMRRDARLRNGGAPAKATVGGMLKNVFTPTVAAAAIGITLAALNFPLPSVIARPIGYLSAMTTPLSMIYIGVMLYNGGKKVFKYERGIASVIVVRLILAAGIAYGACLLTGAGETLTPIFTIQGSLPIMTATAIIAGTLGADRDYAVKGIMWTTVLSLATVTGYSMLLLTL